MRHIATLAMACVAIAACKESEATPEPKGNLPVNDIDTIASPAGTASGEPSVVARPDGSVYLTWLEMQPDSSHALKLARFDGVGWGPTRDITSGKHLVVNWADFPSLAVTDSGRLIAHWLERGTEGGSHAYGIRVVRSTDDGATWSKPMTPHRGPGGAEYGFVSMWSVGDSIGIAWLDGRRHAAKDTAPAMMLSTTMIDPRNTAGSERVLDARTCDCCQTGVARATKGPVIAYRGRTKDEIRDILVVRWVDGAWTEPKTVYADGWNIAACPVNGPQVAALGDTVAVAWFTAAHDTARVNIAFSTDGGATFGAPTRVDDGQPAGRVDLELDDAGRAFVTWIERVGPNAAPAVPAPRALGGRAEVRLRAIGVDGVRSDAMTIATSDAARAAGFPRMARSGDTLIIAWTDPGPPARVRVARATLFGPTLAKATP
jgi:hypothetical protein